MKIGITVRTGGIFALNYSARPKKNVLMILIIKAFLATKTFEKTLFYYKGLSANNIMLVENNEVVREEEKLENIANNNHFTNVTTHLKLKSTNINLKTNLESIINTFQNHESVQRINLTNFHSKFSLKF